MMMDLQMLINAAFGVIMVGAGWFARELWGAVKELQRDLRKIETHLPREYVMRVDLDKRMDHIENMFQRIYDKLDGKMDK